MKLAFYVILCIALLGLVAFIAVFALWIPAPFRTSPVAWQDSIQCNLDFYRSEDGGCASAPRMHARTKIGRYEAVALERRPAVIIEFVSVDGGPWLETIWPYPISQRVDLDLVARPRAAFASLFDCPAYNTQDRFGPSNPDPRVTWTLDGAAPQALVSRARRGDLDAQFELGLGATYTLDEGLAAETIPWLRRAAQAGHVEAMAVYGRQLIMTADYPSPRFSRGASYLRRAGALGEPSAWRVEALLPPAESASIDDTVHRRVTLDMRLAFDCDQKAMERVAWRLATGRGLPRDRALAIDLMIRATYPDDLRAEIDQHLLTQ